MPFTVNGIGTGLVAASKRKKVDGQTQFDAIEALTVFYLPVIPYKAVHVVSEQGDRYQSLPLRMSGRITTKAFLNRWGTILAFFGGFLFVTMLVVVAIMERPFKMEDAFFLVASLAMLLVGVTCKLLWLKMDGVGLRIKDMIGPHQFGTSDPLHWPDELAAPVAQRLLQTESAPGLTIVARRALANGEHAKAMICARLAMRDPRDFEARDLCDRLLTL